jgi:hypothetical protein
VRVILRSAIGLAIAAGGLTFLTYGIAQAFQMGNCGTSSSGVSYGPPCPSGFGPMILLMIFGTFFALGGAALAGVLGRFLAALFVALIAAFVLGIVDVDGGDTRPGLEIVAAVMAPLLVLVLPGIARRPRVVVPFGPAPTTTAEPDPFSRPRWRS